MAWRTVSYPKGLEPLAFTAWMLLQVGGAKQKTVIDGMLGFRLTFGDSQVLSVPIAHHCERRGFVEGSCNQSRNKRRGAVAAAAAAA